MIQNEVSILRRVKHPNIVLLIEEMDVPTELYLVMELVKVSVWGKRNRPPRGPALSWGGRLSSVGTGAAVAEGQ